METNMPVENGCLYSRAGNNNSSELTFSMEEDNFQKKHTWVSQIQVRYIVTICIILLFWICRSVLNHKANQWHEEEKDYMLTLQAVGVGTAFYDGDSAVQSEVQAEDDEGVGYEYHNDDAVASCSDNGAIMLEESVVITTLAALYYFLWLWGNWW